MSGKVVPKSLNFQSSPMSLAIASRAEWRKIGVIGPSTYSPTGTDTFRIRLSSNQILDNTNSWFSIRVNVADHAAALKYSVFDLFDSYRLISNGAVVEEVRQFAPLANMLLKNSVSREWLKSEGVSNYGMKPPYEKTFQAVAGGADDLGKIRYIETAQAIIPDERRTGEIEGGNNVIAAGQSATYNFQLPCGLLAQNNHYIPLGLLGSETFVEFQLNPNALALFNSQNDDPTYTVDNIFYHAHLISTENSLYTKLKAKMSGSADKSLQIAGQQFRSYVNSTSGGDPGSIQVISDQSQSAKAVFTMIVRNDARNAYNRFPSHGSLAGVTSFHYDIGGRLLPPHKVTVASNNMGEMMNHLKIALGQYGDLNGSLVESHQMNATHAGDLLPKAIGEDVTNNTSIKRGDAVFAMSLESFTKHGNSNMESGTDLQSRNLPLKFEYVSGGTGGACQILSYILADCIYYISDSGSILVSI